MILSGFHPLTLLDFPGKTACIVFTVGCNFRCGFCHNPDFVLPERIAKIKNSFIKLEEFFLFLERRQGILDGVTICGGEPTLQHDLEGFIRRIKSMGFLVKLDTNGSNPEVLQKLLFPEGETKPLVNMVAMDIKRPVEGYSNLNTIHGTDAHLPQKLRESMKIISESGVDIEFRTTIAKWVHSLEDIIEVAEEIAELQEKYGCTPTYALQNYRPGDTLNPEFPGASFTEEEMEIFANTAREYLQNTEVIVRR